MMTMKTRRILLSTAFLFACTISFARSLSSAEAMGYAERFFHITHTKGSSPLTLVQDGPANGGMTRAFDNSHPSFYIFNLSGGGFVIISAETAYHPLIAYSLSDSYNPDTVPDNYRWLLDCISNDILQVRFSGTEVDPAVAEEWSGLDSMAAASSVTLNTAEWGQDAPYNLECPKIGSGNCVTGCVATAFCILMHYHGVHHDAPTSPNGITIPSYTKSGRTLPDRDLSGHVYRFKEYPTTTSAFKKSSSDLRNNVAMLMSDVGQAFSMGYGTSSGTATEQSILVMSKYFKYAKNNLMELKDSFTPQEWLSKIRNSIDSDNPIVVSASAESAGHCFILDGYDSNGLVRYNLGWDGLYHNTFTVIAKTVSPDNYNKYAYNYSAVFNYRPDPEGITDFPPSKLQIYVDPNESMGISITNRPVIKGKKISVQISNLSNGGPQSKSSIILRLMKVDGTSGKRSQLGNNVKIVTSLDPGYYFPSFVLESSFNQEAKFGDQLEIDYGLNEDTQNQKWATLDTPSDGSAVLSCPLVPTFVIDLPKECNCSEKYPLKLVNGDFAWAYGTSWSCESTTGGTAVIEDFPSDTHFRQISFKTPGTYLVKATISGKNYSQEQVIAKIVAK